jgi:hypothetical protein
MRVLKMNSRMAKHYSPDWRLAEVELPRTLADEIEAGVICHDGCYVLAKQFVANPHICVDECQDRTGYESFLNHLHLGDCDDDRLIVAFAYLWRLSNLLRRDFPGVEFIGSISSKPDGHECVARFYSKHEGEPPLNADDLEEYEFEAVCLLDLSS